MSPATTAGRNACRSRLSLAPWVRLALGDEPGYFAILLICALVLFPLFDGLWPVFVLTLVGAFLARAWLWCRGAQSEGAAQAHPDKTDSPSERKPI